MRDTSTFAQRRSWVKRLLLEDGRKHAGGYAAAFLLMVVVAGCTSLAAYLMKDIINQIFVDKNKAAMWWLAGVVVGIYTVKGFATYGHTVILARINHAIIAKYQQRLYDHILAQDVSFFASYPSADLMTRLGHAANGAKEVLRVMIVGVGRDVLSLIGLATVMVVQDPFLGLFALLALPLGAVGIGTLIQRIRKFARRSYDGISDIMAQFQESVLGIQVLKAFRLEALLQARMAERIDVVRRSSNKMVMLSATANPITETLGGIVIAAVILVAGHRIVTTGESPGAFFSFLTALLLAYEPAKRLGRMRMEMQNAFMALGLLFEVIDHPAGEKEPVDLPTLKVTAGQVTFEDVHFGYRTDEPVLHGLRFEAKAGETTALVGPSGGGKSTVFALTQRFYTPWSGRLLIDGQDLAQCSRASVREAIAVVAQHVFLFNTTIRDNIRFGRPSATDTEIEDAAKRAFAHDFIMELPQGYDTHVGELGLHLSGGQRQRVAIARALLKNAPLLLLDEATAALDTESEQQVQAALQELSRGRTTLVIAHRLATVADAHKLVVIDKGRVVEEGTHAGLRAQQGLFSRLEGSLV